MIHFISYIFSDELSILFNIFSDELFPVIHIFSDNMKEPIFSGELKSQPPVCKSKFRLNIFCKTNFQNHTLKTEISLAKFRLKSAAMHLIIPK